MALLTLNATGIDRMSLAQFCYELKWLSFSPKLEMFPTRHSNAGHHFIVHNLIAPPAVSTIAHTAN